MRLAFALGAVPPFLAEFASLVVAASVGAYVCYRLGLVPIVGFLLAGVLVGPSALGLVREPAVIDAAAEIGVLLLLFTIGIEFSVEKLARMGRLVVVGGGLQVVGATAVTAGLLALAGVDWRTGVFTGFLVAMSSTALILKVLAERGRTAAPEGEVSVGVSLAQDLASIAMVLLIPALRGGGGGAGSLGVALLSAVALIAVVLVVARRLMPPLLDAIARTCSKELFLLSIIAICLGTALVAGLAGVSLSLGAFLAGLVVSESRLSSHALSEILPLQILFMAAFFVSVGLLLDLGFLVHNLPVVALALTAVVLVKVSTSLVAVRAAGVPLGVGLSASVLLAQVGEFSFVLERVGREAGLSPLGLGEAGSQGFIAATVILMILTPAVAGPADRWAGRLAGRLGPRPALLPDPEPSGEGSAEGAAEAFALVAGYGEGARALVPALAEAGRPFRVVTLSPGGAEEVEAGGHATLLGDYTRLPILEAAGLDRAALLVIPDDAPDVALRTLALARGRRPDLPILVATDTDEAARLLREAGATRVVVRERVARDALIEAALRPFDEPSRPPVVLAPRPDAPCAHAAGRGPVVPQAVGCQACLATGGTWVHLRVCMTCGHVGCCDASPGKHARAHHHGSGHPVVRSLEPGETWGWCYVDKTIL